MERMQTLLPLCLFVLFTTGASERDTVCFRPELPANFRVDGLQRFVHAGSELLLSCIEGYTLVLEPLKIICTDRGEWTKTNAKCIAKQCTYPQSPSNGEMYYEDNKYKSTINYTCHEGYTLIGASSASCQANGTWSASVPYCVPVSCGPAPIPQFGMIIYDRIIKGSTTYYGVSGTYICRPPYALFGNTKAECTASGKWTETPECRVVTCPPPENIDKGYMSNNDNREYDYMETVRYGCHGDYVLEGSFQSVCQQNKKWSEKPSCKAPCSIDIRSGRILYNGQKLWIRDLNPKSVSHLDIVSVYCLEKSRGCGYAVPTQCIDGKLKIPECFEEPSGFNYTFESHSLPSEIEQC